MVSVAAPGVRVGFDRSAGANQVPVAVCIVDSPHMRPELVIPQPRGREGRLRAGVAVGPCLGHHVRCGVRRILEIRKQMNDGGAGRRKYSDADILDLVKSEESSETIRQA